MFDINCLYKNGVTSFKLRQQHLERLSGYINKESWVKNIGQNDKVFPCDDLLAIPLWAYNGFNSIDFSQSFSNEYEKESYIKKTLSSGVPKKYLDYFSIIFNSPIYNGNLPGLYNSEIKVSSVSLWNGVSDFNWHWDGPGNDDIYALIYLSDYEKWPEEFGAGLEYGMASMSEQGYKDVEKKGVFYPDNGRIVIGENRNPLWVHRTQHYSQEALNNKINRFTFLVTMRLERKKYD